MEPITAAWLVGIVAQTAAKAAGAVFGDAVDRVEDALAERMTALVQRIRAHFQGDAGAEDALDRLEQQPSDPRRQAAVEERLEEALANDPEFAAAVARLAEPIREAGAQRIDVRGSGAVAVGGDVTIRGGMFAAGRDVHAQGEPRPDATGRLP